MKKGGLSEPPPLSDIKDYDALDSIWSALEARPSFLASRLRDGSASPEELKVAADLIEGEIKPRRLRPGASSRHKRLRIAEYVAFLERVLPHVRRKDSGGKGRIFRSKEVIPLAAEEHGVKPRHVYAALAEFDGDALAHVERMYPDFHTRAENMPQLAELDPAHSKHLRDALKNAGHDVLVEIIEEFVALELVTKPRPMAKLAFFARHRAFSCGRSF